jgi:hypothetical protein
MIEDHPTTLPPELVEQWDEEGTAMFRPEYQLHIATQAARWGADQELEACCEWLACLPSNWVSTAQELSLDIRAARRPKPPSLKEQALALLEPQGSPARLLNEDQMGILRRALEQLDD